MNRSRKFCDSIARCGLWFWLGCSASFSLSFVSPLLPLCFSDEVGREGNGSKTTSTSVDLTGWRQVAAGCTRAHGDSREKNKGWGRRGFTSVLVLRVIYCNQWGDLILIMRGVAGLPKVYIMYVPVAGESIMQVTI